MLRKTEEKAKEKKALLSVSVSSARLQVTATATAFATFSFFPSGKNGSESGRADECVSQRKSEGCFFIGVSPAGDRKSADAYLKHFT